MYFGNSGSMACVSRFLNLKPKDCKICQKSLSKKENCITGYLREVVAYALVCVWKDPEVIRTSDCANDVVNLKVSEWKLKREITS